MTDKASIIFLVRQMAERDGGRAPGREKFDNETGIKPHVWRGKL